MSRLTELIAQAKAKDPQLNTDLDQEFKQLSSRLPPVLSHAPAGVAPALDPVAAVHAATSLRAGVAAPMPAPAPAVAVAPTAVPSIALPRATASATKVFEIIRARRAVGAFHDDEAAALLAIDPAREWIVHFGALGVPAL